MEEQLVTGLLEGKRDIINKIYAKYLNTAIAWISKNNGSRQDGLDVFQEALMHILISAKKGKLVIKSSFGAYLLSTCKYLWLGKIRKENRLSIVRNIPEETLTIEAPLRIEEAEKDYWLHSFLENNRKKLSETCNQLLSLLAQNKKPGEIAVQLQMTNANTVYRRKFACFKKWRELIESDPMYHQWKELENGS